MNKKFLPLVIVGAVVLLAVGAFAFFSTNKGSLPGTVQERAAEGSKSLRDLMAAGGSQKCEFKDDEGNSGTSYISGGKVRTDYTTLVEGVETSGHMILDGNTMYTWMDGENQGFMMTFDPEDVNDEDVPETAGDGASVDLDEETDYTCSPWTVNASFFSPPSNVDFQDFSSFIPPQGGEIPEDFNPESY